MSTDKTLSLLCADSGETEAFGERLGRKLKGREVIELLSDLGGGKTTLTRGIARGVGSQDTVSSPTFTISKMYKSPTITLYHFDFYRLQEAGLMAHELHDALEDPDGVVIIEWGKVIESVLPKGRLKIHISKVDDGARKLEISYPEELDYLVA